MATVNPPTPSRKLPWLLSAVGLLAVALVVRSQLSPAHPKHRLKLADAEAIPNSEPAPVARTHAAEPEPAVTAPPPRLPSSALPRNINAQAYLDERFPKQAAPTITVVPKFSEADKERTAREMFPEYRRIQEGVEAERKRLGLSAEE